MTMLVAQCSKDPSCRTDLDCTGDMKHMKDMNHEVSSPAVGQSEKKKNLEPDPLPGSKAKQFSSINKQHPCERGMFRTMR